jgi:hypothetical protein
MRCAVVEPTNPPPTTVTFFRMSAFSCMGQNESELRQERLPVVKSEISNLRFEI